MQDSFNREPVSYEDALRELVAKRRRRRLLGAVKHLDPRPTSSGQVLVAGLIFVVVGFLLPIAHAAVTIGLILLVAGFVTGMMKPRMRRVVWRQREIELPGDETWATRLYRIIYRT